MAIFRGTTGTGSSDNTIVSAVTEQAGIATTKASEASASATTATTKASEASASATTASTKATEANASATTATTKASEASSHETMAGVFRQAAQDQANIALGHANTANSSAVQTVAGSNTQVVGVYNNIANVNTVAGVNTDVTTVAGISSDVTTVAADASDIGTVSTNIANVNNVGNNIANVNAVHGNASNINTVAADGTDIGTVATNIANVNTVAGISSTVTTVAGLESKMDTVIADASDIGAVAGNIGDITAVAGINSDVDTVAGIAAKVTTVADNITDVQNADTNAANAASSASNASASATSASNSATTATTKATEASNSATAASNSATTATTKASQAAGSATTAGTSASTATTKASEASASATTATTKAGEAASSASAASGSATTATTKAAEADVSATSAATSATKSSNAASTWNNFYNSYLGVADAPPSVDVLGNAIVAGALYYDTGAGSNTVGLYVYNGSSWVYSTNYNNVTAPYSLAQDLATNSHDINFGDNAKAIFGASNDLQIYHDGSTNKIVGSIDVTGTATMDGLTVDGGGVSTLSNIGYLGDNTGSVQYTLRSSDAGTGTIDFGDSSDGNIGRIQYIHASNAMTLRTNNSERMRIDSSGNVGIGTTSPHALLHVDGGDVKISSNSGTSNGDGKPTIFFSESGADEVFAQISYHGDDQSGTNNFIGIGCNGSSGTSRALMKENHQMVVTAGGNVGIGTSSPDHLLCLEGAEPTLRIFDSANTLNQEQTISFGTEPGNRTQAEIASINTNTGNASGSLSFKTNSGASLTERLRIDSSGNVGIGTTSPSGALHVAGKSTGRNTIVSNVTLDGGSAVSNPYDGFGFGINFTGKDYGNAVRDYAHIYSVMEAAGSSAGGGDAGFTAGLRFYTNGGGASGATPTERLRIDSSGNVRIGTVLPQTSANFNLRRNGTNIEFGHGNRTSGYYGTLGSQYNNGQPYMGFSCDADDSGNTFTTRGFKGNVLIGTPTGDLTFNQITTASASGQTPSERMRIDSSGNILVGKTSQAYATAGLELEGAGRVVATRDGASAGIFARLNSDGDIVNFRKGGTTVGSIGSYAGTRLAIGSNGVSGAVFGQNAVIPATVTPATNGTTLVNNAYDLGTSSYKWKDLYLSGGVHLGGTGSANKLDDYEEGTWSPVIYGSTGGTGSGTVAQARYTKVGRLVQVQCYLHTYTATGLTGNVRMSGLPFTANGYHPIVISYASLFSFDESDISVSGYTESGASIINLTKGSSTTLIPASEATSGALMLNFSYYTL